MTYDRHTIHRDLVKTLEHYTSQKLWRLQALSDLRNAAWFGRSPEMPCTCIEGSMIVALRLSPRITITAEEWQELYQRDQSEAIYALRKQGSHAVDRLHKHPSFLFFRDSARRSGALCQGEDPWSLHDRCPQKSVAALRDAIEEARAQL